MEARRHIAPLAWSLAAHAVVIGVLLRAVTAPVPPIEPVRLTFVDPPPPPPLAGGQGGASGAQPAPTAQAPVRPIPAPAVARPRPQPPRNRPVPKPVPKTPPPAAARGDAKQPSGSETGARAGAAGGTQGGVAGGVVGGTGTSLPRASEVATPPVVVRRVTPRYPREARAQGAAGLVLLEAVLDREGRVEDHIRVLRSVPLLDDAAVEALRQWRFRPARDHHRQTVRVVLEVPMRFVLE